MSTAPTNPAPRMGVAHWTAMAFKGIDLTPIWNDLTARVSRNREDAGIGLDLSVIAQLMGDQVTGLAIQKEVLGYQRLFRSPCAVELPGLKVLALAAEMDVGGNTPIEFLLEGSDVELTTLYVPTDGTWIGALPKHDVAIVVAPDDDKSQEALATIDKHAGGWPTAMLNRPQSIRNLDRDRLCRVLRSVSGLSIPATVRIERRHLSELDRGNLTSWISARDGAFPLIVRPIGSHAGYGLAKLETPGDIAHYLSFRPENEFFISPFVDYASSDGLFRKYRLAIVDRVPYPCHMAISGEWRIWYLNAEMAENADKRAEEEAFMTSFDQAFAVRHASALVELSARIGLDYFQIDCAETREGALLIFEADNTAIVHNMDPPDKFPYKAPQMRKIFGAFVSMLYRRAGKAQACAT